jgi:DNA polymerase-3 subunit epsilon
VFEHWCGLGSVEDESGLDTLMNAKSEKYFDLDTYKLLLKALGQMQSEIIQLPA